MALIPRIKIVAAVLLAALGTMILVWFVPSKIIPPSWDFHTNLWGPAYLLVHRASPYNIEALVKGGGTLWMPVVIGLLFPFGYLPLQWASNIWLLLNLTSLYLMVTILGGISQKNIIWIMLMTFSLVIFPTSVSHLILGQVSLIICLLLLVLSIWRDRLTPAMIGPLFAFCFTKPQLMILFLPVYLVVCFREQGAGKVLWIVMSTAISSALFCLPLFFLHPDWIPDFLNNLSNDPPWFYPTLYSYIGFITSSRVTAIALAGIYLIIGWGIAVYAVLKLDALEALLWALAITPVFSPVIWSWDFVLLYPLLVFMMFKKKSRISSWVIYGGYAICTLGFVIMRINGYIAEQFTGWVPPFLNGTLLLGYIFQRTNLRHPNLPKMVGSSEP